MCLAQFRSLVALPCKRSAWRIYLEQEGASMLVGGRPVLVGRPGSGGPAGLHVGPGRQSCIYQ